MDAGRDGPNPSRSMFMYQSDYSILLTSKLHLSQTLY